MFGFLSAKLEINTEGPIKYGQTKETGNIGYTRRRQANHKQNTICLGHHLLYANRHK